MDPGHGWNKVTCVHCDSAPSSALRRRACTDEQFAPRAWVEQGYVRALRQRPVVCSATPYMYWSTVCTPGVGGTRVRACTATAPRRLLCDAEHVLINSLHPGRGWNKGACVHCDSARRLLCDAVHVLINSLHPGRGWNKGTCVHCDSAPSSALPRCTCTDEQFAPRAWVEQGYVRALRQRPVVCSATPYMYWSTVCTPGVAGTRVRVCTATWLLFFAPFSRCSLGELHGQKGSHLGQHRGENSKNSSEHVLGAKGEGTREGWRVDGRLGSK